MQIDLDTLDEVSRDFITFVSEWRPGWLAYARPMLDEGWNTYSVEIEFPNPAGVEHQEPLWISTYGKEVTVGMDAHHTHFPWPLDYNGEDGRPAAMEHIDALMNEELMIVSLWDSDRLCVSSSDTPENLSKYEERPDGLVELRIRSWRGSYNRTLRFDWDSYLTLVRGSPA